MFAKNTKKAERSNCGGEEILRKQHTSNSPHPPSQSDKNRRNFSKGEVRSEIEFNFYRPHQICRMEIREIDETIHEGDQTSASSCPDNQGVYFPVEVFTRQHDGTSKF